MEENDKREHSEVGMASFVLGIICVALYLLWYLTNVFDKDFGDFINLVLQVSPLLLPLGGIILGIVGLFQRDFKKTLSILGVSLNVLLICFSLWNSFIYIMMQ